MKMNPFKHFKLGMAALITVSATLLASCATETIENADGNNRNDSNETLQLYATTGYIADAVTNIAPDAEVITMVGPGGDPHTYQPTTQEIETMDKSDLILWNGLELEAQMGDQLKSYGDRQLAVAETLDESQLLALPGDGGFDPHVWNSPSAWQDVVHNIAKRLGELDPENAQEYVDNATAYNKEIEAVHQEVLPALESIPEPRILITGHDAFNYFGATYDLEVRATDFISTEAALSATELSELADFIADNKIPVVFQDNQANPQAIDSLKEAVQARGWNVIISDEELFADSLGPTDPVNTFVGVFRHNATTVAEGLS